MTTYRGNRKLCRALRLPLCTPETRSPYHATGTFTVNDRRRFFARLQAYWRTFGIREHAVMAIAHESRFLLIGHTPEPDLGMWYIFVQPERVKSVEAGTLAIGSHRGPGLALRYEGEPPEGRSRKRPAPARQHEVAYLMFATEADRNSVWADLLAGATGSSGLVINQSDRTA